MSNIMTYDELLNTLDSFEAYSSFSIHKLEQDFWLKVQAENTLQAYERYLSTFPKGVHKKDALNCISNIKRQQKEWAKQQKKDAQQLLELEKQRKRDQAIAEDKQAYEEARDANTLSSYEFYLWNYPSGLYRSEATLNFNKFNMEQERAEKIRAEKRIRENLLYDHKRNLSFLIGGLFASIILSILFFIYPAQTLVVLVIASSCLAGLMLDFDHPQEAIIAPLVFSVPQILLFVFFHEGLVVIYYLVLGGALIGLSGYLLYILKLYLDVKKDNTIL